MKNVSKCPRCGSTEVHAGKILAPGSLGLFFRPDNTKALVVQDVVAKGRMCADCGSIELLGDEKTLRQNLKTK
jgi:predicted nucleic-acid-binding Zn-ribbon protein